MRPEKGPRQHLSAGCPDKAVHFICSSHHPNGAQHARCEVGNNSDRGGAEELAWALERVGSRNGAAVPAECL